MTEKNYNPEQKQMKAMKKMDKTRKTDERNIAETPKKEKPEEKNIEKKEGTRPSVADLKKEETHPSETELKKEEIKVEVKKGEKETRQADAKMSSASVTKLKKKTEAVVRGIGIPISSKQSFAISKFIKNKEIQRAVRELEEILLHKRALPMKGEIPHRKGEIMSGRYPRNAIREFIKLLKSLGANASVNEISNPIIFEAYGNFASRPYGKFGRIRKKRSNVTIVAREETSSKRGQSKEKMENKK